MAYAGKLTYKTELDTSGVQKAGSTVKSIIAGLGITKMISMAMSQIENSVDGAIKRIDTFNQYPKALQNFGVSAEEANKSIKRIDKSVRGLPTSLDQAVSGVQNIFMVTKDLGKAENIFKAINDSAMVFAQGSTESVERFSYAYKQALASGKVYAQDFNQMNQAIPGIMDKVAESMGISFSELKDGLSEGTISMDEFNEALITLDTQGINGMEALEEVAKTSTGGIATSIANAKTAITRGVADLITGLNNALTEANLPSVNEIIKNIGKTTETVLKGIAKNLPQIIETTKKLIPYLITIGTIIAGYKLGSKINSITKSFQEAKLQLALFAMQSKGASMEQALLKGTLTKTEGIVGLLTGKLKLTTLAQQAFNTVLKANPIGIIITAIVGLIGLLVLLYNKNEEFRKSVNEAFEQIKQSLQSAWQMIKPALEELMEALKPIGEFIANVLIVGIQILIEVLNILIPIITSIIIIIIEVVTTIITIVTNLVTTIVNFFTKTIPDAIKTMNNFVKTIPSKLLSFFGGLAGKMLNIGLDIVKGIGKGITSGVSWIKNRIKEFVGNVTGFIKKVFKIGSPSKLMADEVGQWLPKGIAVGIDTNTDSVEDSLEDMYREMNKTIKMENSRMNFDVLSGDVYNKSFLQTPISIDLNANVEMDSQKVGRLVTPSVTKTIKNGGGI